MSKQHYPQSAPLLRIALSLVVGIAVASRVPLAAGVVVGLLAVAVVAAWLSGRWPVVQSAVICVCFVVLGMAAWQWRSDGGERPSGAVGTWFLEQREVLLQRYRLATDDEAQYAVLAAMTLGDKRALTPELRETYSRTGASHVLALSGLHLGIIYLLLSRLTMGRRHHWLSQVVVILGIWAFAFLTGLSTSLVRSATMISLFALFSAGGRGHASLNVLSFTAIVMLVANARMLFDVGFQMSFMAVGAILLFMPLFDALVPMNRLYRHRLLKWVYSLAAVSVAAQLGVAPLIAFYFHRFSTWFLLTNFVVIPLATLILYGALFAFVVPPAGHLLAWVVGLLNGALAHLSRLPLASIDGLHVSLLQLALLYVLIACLYFILRLWTMGRSR